MNLIPAQAGAQLISLIVFASAARWYVVPWLYRQPRADALIALLWVHVFRYVALQVYSAARLDHFPISTEGARDIVVGDIAGAILAFVAILLLRRRIRIGLVVAGFLVLETAFDTVTNIESGTREHLMGAASGVTWMVLVYFVPMVIVSTALIGLQLYSRRGEILGDTAASGSPATGRPAAAH